MTSSPVLIASRWTRRRRELGCTVRTTHYFPLYTDKDGRRVRYRLADGFRAKLPAPFTPRICTG